MDRQWGSRLLEWFDNSKRDLPWRKTRDPYAIWISEVMLQQTQVATVVPYFERWMRRFPDVKSLAAADEQTVLAHWQGLGYYRRGRMLLEGARHIAHEGVPADAAGWLRIPGVGRYTAGAIASIANREATPVVDGNVRRVYARMGADHASGGALDRSAWKWAQAVLHQSRPGDWNQALMELGATLCAAKAPQCGACPIAEACEARRLDLQDQLPTPNVRPPVIRMERRLIAPECEGRLGFCQIPTGDWCAGMWTFPSLSEEDGSPPWLPENATVTPIGDFRHVVTHHHIRVTVSLARVASPHSDLRWLAVEDLPEIPMPSPQRRALEMVIGALAG